jgi:hypothetical protein
MGISPNHPAVRQALDRGLIAGPPPPCRLRVDCSEDEFLAFVLAHARWRGWLCYHTHDSRKSEPGFPDLVMVRGERLLIVELKAANGRFSDAQREWLAAFDLVPGVETCRWKPHDVPAIVAVLTDKQGGDRR